MLSIFSYIWTKCFFYKYQIQLIWLLHPPLRLIIECGDPDCFSLVRRCHYFTHKNNKLSYHICNKNSGWWLVWIVSGSSKGFEESEKWTNVTSLHQSFMLRGVYLFRLCSTFFNVSSNLLLLDLCVFSALSFSRSEIKQTSKFSGVSIIRIKNNI